jgi:hypothetical protein
MTDARPHPPWAVCASCLLLLALAGPRAGGDGGSGGGGGGEGDARLVLHSPAPGATVLRPWERVQVEIVRQSAGPPLYVALRGGDRMPRTPALEVRVPGHCSCYTTTGLRVHATSALRGACSPAFLREE